MTGNERSSAKIHHLTVLDLFSGPGGMSEGIRKARNHNFRFKVVVANDYDRAVESTYTKNHSGVEFVPGSITEEKTKADIVSAIRCQTGRSTVDVVVGGPPCKGFSLENKMTRNMDNPMNHLVSHYLEMIRRVKPAAFVMENVPGIFAMQKGEVMRSLLSAFRSLGYHNSTAWLLNAADYGVPQLRKRAFVVGSKSEIPLEQPKKTHGSRKEVAENPSLIPHVTLSEAIGDLPQIRTGSTEANRSDYPVDPKSDYQRRIRRGSGRITNHTVTKNTEIVTRRMRKVPPGGNWENIPVRLMKVGGRYGKLELAHSMIYKRLRKNVPSVTITNFRKAMIIHPTQSRLLSVREAARIQTFPDSFEFEGGLSNMQQQVSDAVPVHLAKKVGDVVLLHLHDVIKLVPAYHGSRMRAPGGR